jgi:uncharacterized delta-60 repeat protein
MRSGRRDRTFGSGGKVKTLSCRWHAIVLQPNRKLVVDGRSGSGFAVARYRQKGSLDRSFGVHGIASTEIVGTAWGLALQRDGKIIAVGSSWHDSSVSFAVVRFKRSGALDASFGTGGIVTTDFGGDGFVGEDGAQAVAVRKDGKIVVVGTGRKKNRPVFALARYRRNGSLDDTFGANGMVKTNWSRETTATDAAFMRSGKIVVAGWSYHNGTQFALARYRPNGSLDRRFGSDGKVITSISGSFDYASAVAIQPDRRIVLAGSAGIRVSGPNRAGFALARYLGRGR